MLKALFFSLLLTITLFSAEDNASKKDTNNTDANISDKNNTELNKNLQKAIEKEKKYKKEQKFYLGKDYNLSEHEIDLKSLDKVPVIEPEYDFDMDDVYSD